ncbi:hypothetical protein GOP47_0027101 [Adiantum capillus-veneris]|nr:hypothetical protein GOP47_0027101 [Adiantum capillus-veneris]
MRLARASPADSPWHNHRSWPTSVRQLQHMDDVYTACVERPLVDSPIAYGGAAMSLEWLLGTPSSKNGHGERATPPHRDSLAGLTTSGEGTLCSELLCKRACSQEQPPLDPNWYQPCLSALVTSVTGSNQKGGVDFSQNKWEDVLRRPIPSRMAAYDIIKKMLSELHDPYTRFITPAELKQLSKYDMTGIGISIGEAGDEDNDATLRVVGVVLGSSGQLAGIKQGDEILSVNGVDIHGKSAFEASSLIQGIKGTFVSVEVRHGLCKDTQSLSIERKQTVQTPVYFRLEHRGGDLLGYIHLKEFNAVARRHLVTAMNKLTAAGATSFVLDLRNNPGGLVQVGVEIARLFLDKGDTVVYTVSRNPQDQKGIFAKSPPLTKAPLVILVNEHTASASEIVAASLQDNCRAVLVGHRTFGKGLIQSVFELSDGSGVILTVGMYVTPHHHEIDQNGIYPDFQELPDLVDVNKKIQMCVSS